MSNKYFICCEQCFESIARKNSRAAKSWMDFCAYHLEIGPVLCLQEEQVPELRLLENLGFLVSTDTEDGSLIRVKGQMNTEQGEPFFCARKGRHV